MKTNPAHAIIPVLASGLLLLLSSGPAEAQDRPADGRLGAVQVLPQVAPQARAWIGLQVEEGSTPGELLVVEVDPGSPGESAGLLAGETLVEVEGGPATVERLREEMTPLSPGDTIRLRVRSEAGETRAVAVETGTPQRSIRIVRADGDTVTVRVSPAESLADMWEALGIPEGGLAGFRGQVGEMSPDARALSIIRGAPGIQAMGDTVYLPSGQRIVGGVIQSRSLAGMGRDGMAGARFTPINEGLAAYFGVERGLLVVEVVEDTPAADAGLRAGDVVVQVAGIEVRAIEELRQAMAQGYRSPPVALRIVRDGQELELELDR